jgi:hypothetical protein
MFTVGNINAGMVGGANSVAAARVAASAYLPLPLHRLPLPYRDGQRVDVAMSTDIRETIV